MSSKNIQKQLKTLPRSKSPIRGNTPAKFEEMSIDNQIKYLEKLKMLDEIRKRKKIALEKLNICQEMENETKPRLSPEEYINKFDRKPRLRLKQARAEERADKTVDKIKKRKNHRENNFEEKLTEKVSSYEKEGATPVKKIWKDYEGDERTATKKEDYSSSEKNLECKKSQNLEDQEPVGAFKKLFNRRKEKKLREMGESVSPLIQKAKLSDRKKISNEDHRDSSSEFQLPDNKKIEKQKEKKLKKKRTRNSKRRISSISNSILDESSKENYEYSDSSSYKKLKKKKRRRKQKLQQIKKRKHKKRNRKRYQSSSSETSSEIVESYHSNADPNYMYMENGTNFHPIVHTMPQRQYQVYPPQVITPQAYNHQILNSMNPGYGQMAHPNLVHPFAANQEYYQYGIPNGFVPPQVPMVNPINRQNWNRAIQRTYYEVNSEGNDYNSKNSKKNNKVGKKNLRHKTNRSNTANLNYHLDEYSSDHNGLDSYSNNESREAKKYPSNAKFNEDYSCSEESDQRSKKNRKVVKEQDERYIRAMERIENCVEASPPQRSTRKNQHDLRRVSNLESYDENMELKSSERKFKNLELVPLVDPNSRIGLEKSEENERSEEKVVKSQYSYYKGIKVEIVDFEEETKSIPNLITPRKVVLRSIDQNLPNLRSDQNPLENSFNNRRKNFSKEKVQTKFTENKENRVTPYIENFSIENSPFKKRDKIQQEGELMVFDMTPSQQNEKVKKGETSLKEAFLKKKKSLANRIKKNQQNQNKKKRTSPISRRELIEIRRQMLAGKSRPRIPNKQFGKADPELISFRDLPTPSKSRSKSINQRKTPPKAFPNLKLLERLAKGEKTKVGKKEMYELTRKNFQQLPEYKKKLNEQKKKEDRASRMQRVKEFNKVRIPCNIRM